MQPAPLTILLLLLASAEQALAAGKKTSVTDWTNKYDAHFKKQSKHYFGPNHDWRWFKAQAVAESGLDPQAESKSGARGIMQIMPATYREIKEKNPHLKDIDSPRWNIAAGIYYDRKLYKRWVSPPDENERLYFAFGSYNAGYTRIIKSLKRADPPTASWEKVEHHVPGQTRHYVRRIRSLMDDL